MLVQNNAFPCVSVSGSMSSIKRDVKKKVLPRPESRFVSRDPAHFPSASLQGFCLLILISFSATGGNSIELRERQASVVDCVNHGSIRGWWQPRRSQLHEPGLKKLKERLTRSPEGTKSMQ